MMNIKDAPECLQHDDVALKLLVYMDTMFEESAADATVVCCLCEQLGERLDVQMSRACVVQAYGIL